MLEALGPHLESGLVKLYCVAAITGDSWMNKKAHPGHRSYMQAMYDAYITEEVVPFIRSNCQSPDIKITTTGSSLGGYHAANTLLKHPRIFNRCFAMSGVYDMREFMHGYFDDNFYFNNPVDYMANMHQHEELEAIRRTEIHLSTGHGAWEDRRPTDRLSQVLSSKAIPHHLDDWGPLGGHDWPYWRHQISYYLRNG